MRIRDSVLLTAGLLSTLSLAASGPLATSAFVRGTEIYVVTQGSSQPRQITADGLKKGTVALSKDGSLIAFTRDTKLSELANIAIIKPDGTFVRQIHFRPADANVQGMRWVEALQWATNQRLIASGSVDPSTGEYAVIDTTTGEEADDFLVDGLVFSPSQDGSHFAYAAYIAHFTPEADRRPQLCLDDECDFDKPRRGYPPPDRHIEFVGIPVWSPDGARVAIAAEDYTTKAQSVIVREVHGKAAEFAAPPEAGTGLSFAWEDSTIRIKTANGEWKLQPDRAGALVWFRMK